MTFESIELGEIVEIVMGQAPPGAACNKDGNGTVFVKAGEFQERSPAIREWTTQPLKMAAPNDSLVCVVGATSGKVNYSAFECAIGRSVAAVRPQVGRIDPAFLFQFLLTKVEQLRDRSQGAAQGVITREMLQSLKLVLPPLPEQRRIAAILDKADTLRSKRREAMAQLDRLAQSIFVGMFGDPVTNPNNLLKQPLGDLLKVKSGDFLPASEMALDGQYPVFGGNGVNGRHDEYMFDRRQIVVGRVGVYCGCVHMTPANCWVTDNALYVSEHDSRIDFDFLAFSLKLANLNQYASQSAQPLISGARIYPVEIFVPPKEQQTEFIARVAAIKQVNERCSSSSKELDSLFTSLQHGAFRGEL